MAAMPLIDNFSQQCSASAAAQASNYPYNIISSDYSSSSANLHHHHHHREIDQFSSGSATSIESTTTPPPPLIFSYPPKLMRINNEFGSSSLHQKHRSSMETMREMIFRIAMMQPIQIDPESVKPPKRKNVKISKDPQSVAARHRRERISEKIRILQRLVPGGTKMDTASMLDEAAHYLKFLKKQVQSLELEQASSNARPNLNHNAAGIPITMATAATTYSNFIKSCQLPPSHMQMLS